MKQKNHFNNIFTYSHEYPEVTEEINLFFNCYFIIDIGDFKKGDYVYTIVNINNKLTVYENDDYNGIELHM